MKVYEQFLQLRSHFNGCIFIIKCKMCSSNQLISAGAAKKQTNLLSLALCHERQQITLIDRRQSVSIFSSAVIHLCFVHRALPFNEQLQKLKFQVKRPAECSYDKTTKQIHRLFGLGGRYLPFSVLSF